MGKLFIAKNFNAFKSSNSTKTVNDPVFKALKVLSLRTSNQTELLYRQMGSPVFQKWKSENFTSETTMEINNISCILDFF